MPGTYYTKKRPKMKAKPIKRDKSRDSEMTKINEYLDNLKLPKKISNSSLTKISAEYNKKKTKSKRKSPKKSKSVRKSSKKSKSKRKSPKKIKSKRKSPKKSKSKRKSPKKIKSKRKSPKKSKRKVTNVGMKIKKLMKEGYPHKQAVAIALSMEKSNKLGPRGGYKKSPKKTKSKSTAASLDSDSEDEMEFRPNPPPNPPGRRGLINNPFRKKMGRPRSVKKESAVKKSSVRPRGRPPKGKKWNGTKYVVELPIQPTDDESLFETYLAILTDILGVEEIYQGLIDYYNDEENRHIKFDTVATKSAFPRRETGDTDPIIYNYEPGSNGDTHFRVYKPNPNATRAYNAWEIVDPYDLYQKPRTQGFCQMFAYFIATDNTDEFIMVNGEDSDDNKKIVYQKNTYLCLRKVLQLINAIKEKPKPDLIQKMEEGFQDCKDYKNKDKRKEYGIVDKSMTFEDFIKNLGYFKEESAQKYIDDLYDKKRS